MLKNRWNIFTKWKYVILFVIFIHKRNCNESRRNVGGHQHSMSDNKIGNERPKATTTAKKSQYSFCFISNHFACFNEWFIWMRFTSNFHLFFPFLYSNISTPSNTDLFALQAFVPCHFIIIESFCFSVSWKKKKNKLKKSIDATIKWNYALKCFVGSAEWKGIYDSWKRQTNIFFIFLIIFFHSHGSAI